MKQSTKLLKLPVFNNNRPVFKGLKLMCDDTHYALISLSLKELQSFSTEKLTDDFKCLEGWRIEGVHWEGIPVSSVIAKMKLQPKIRWFLFGAGNFSCLISRRRALKKTTLLATRMNGRKLNSIHGGPLRLVFKGQKCYESVKSVDRIIALEKPQEATARKIAISRIT